MSRKLLIHLHLFMAAFFTPILLITVISGGLYLLGYKGEVTQQEIYSGELTEFNINADEPTREVDAFIEKHQLNINYDYILKRGDTMFTRPTSKSYLTFQVKDDNLTVKTNQPDFIKRIVELHKGHGPSLFKIFQQIMAFGILGVLISGFYLGVSSPTLRNKTLMISGSGGLIFLLLVLF